MHITTPFLRIAFATSAILSAGALTLACSGNAETDAASAEASNLDVSPASAPHCEVEGSGLVAQGMCAICCAGNGPAKPIFVKTARCLRACGLGAHACQNECWAEYDEACSG